MPVGREWPHNFAVLARGLLNGDFMFRTICEFNELRVAKTDSATPAAINLSASVQRDDVHQFLATKDVSSK